MASMHSAMNYLRKRFSEANIKADNFNEQVNDEEEEPVTSGPSSPHSSITSSEKSPAKHISTTEHQKGKATTSGGFFASLAAGNPLAVLKPENQEKYKVVLIIDDHHTDWSKYFKGKKIHNEYSIRVEQAEFAEINLFSHSFVGTTVDINCYRSGSHVVRSFKPDFLLVRQATRSMVAGEDFRNLIIGFKYGGVPSVNSLHAQYNFMDKPWTFSQLIRMQKKLGREKFPLIEQTYYPSYKQMVTSSSFPVVVKIGHAHRGMAKFKVEDHYQFQDVVSVAALTNAYVIVEAFIDAQYDVRVQKIGRNYKTYIRASVSNTWKANTGSAMLEEVSVTDRHRLWADACCEMFGGLDIVAVKALHGKDGRDYIIEVTDCNMSVIEERQEEDRKMIADLVMQRMTSCIPPRSDASNHLFARREQLNARNVVTTWKKSRNYASSNKKSTSAPPSCPASGPSSTYGSEPSSPCSSGWEDLDGDTMLSGRGKERKLSRSKTTSSEDDDESKAEKIRSLRRSFVNLFNTAT